MGRETERKRERALLTNLLWKIKIVELPVEKVLERENAGDNLEAEVESFKALAVEEAHILSAIFEIIVS